MKNLLFFVLAVTLLAGCKPSDTRPVSANGPVKSIGGLTVPGQTNYSTTELTIGKRICAALIYKREKMAKLTDMAEKFAFTGQWKACGETSVLLAQYGVSISNIGGDLKYIPDLASSKAFKDVVTDESEPIKTLCSNLLVSASVSNFFNLQGTSYFIKLYNLDGFDTYELSKMTKNSRGAFALSETQKVEVITSVTPSLDLRLLGIEKIRIVNSACAGSTDYTSLGHTWVSAVTAYKLPTE
jgi:hypothetical protein